MFCLRCKREFGSGIAFCPDCGAPLSHQPNCQNVVIIGRGRGVDFHIENPRISQRHASLTPQGDGSFLLRDLNSRNGVFVGSPNNRVSSAVVVPGDIVFLADHKITVAELINRCTDAINHRRFFIGRERENDIRLKHASVSRRHAVLEQMPDGAWKLEDIGSQNGTFVGSQKIAQIIINESDLIRFGTYEIKGRDLFAAVSRMRKRRLHKAGLHRAGLVSRFKLAFKDLPYIRYAAITLPIIALALFYISPLTAPKNPLPPSSMPVPGDSPSAGQVRPDSGSQELLERATVLVITKSGYGTGFFIAPNLILTNRHVAERKNNVCLVLNKALRQPIEAVVVATSASADNNKDYAVLRLKKETGIQPLKFSLQSKRAERVAAWGYPGLLIQLDNTSIPEVVYSSGEINVVYDSPPIIAHTAAISQGNSGGPLVNERGQVLGVNTLFLQDDPKKSYRQVFLALKASDILAFLRKNNLPYTLAE